MNLQGIQELGIDQTSLAYHQVTGIEELIPSMHPLFEKHFAESATHQDILLKPNAAEYGHFEKLGILRFFVAKAGEETVGYASFFINRHPHFADSLQAVNDLLFLDPDYRGPGAEFIRHCESELQAEGVEVIFFTSPAQRRDLSPLFERLGYVATDIRYSKRLVGKA